MADKAFFDAVARYNEAYWWLRAALTLACIWLVVDLARKAPWAEAGLKFVLALSCIVIGTVASNVFSPRTFPPAMSEEFRIWAPLTMKCIFLGAGAAGLIDVMIDSTRLRLPRGGWRLAAVIAGCILGLGFPAYELVLGHIYPRAQAFGTSPAPLVLVLVLLLGASAPTRIAGGVWFWLVALAGIAIGVVAPIFGLPHGQVIVGIATALGLAMRLRPGPTEAAPATPDAAKADQAETAT